MVALGDLLLCPLDLFLINIPESSVFTSLFLYLLRCPFIPIMLFSVSVLFCFEIVSEWCLSRPTFTCTVYIVLIYEMITITRVSGLREMSSFTFVLESCCIIWLGTLIQLHSIPCRVHLPWNCLICVLYFTLSSSKKSCLLAKYLDFFL